MNAVKNFLNVILIGGILGALIFAWFSPSLISWYYTPPAELVFSCSSTMEWTLSAYRKVMFVGVLLGVISSAILYFALTNKKKSSQSSENTSVKNEL